MDWSRKEVEVLISTSNIILAILPFSVSKLKQNNTRRGMTGVNESCLARPSCL
jgi:hypothetical protein